jgi:hypothetical protein
MFNPIISRFSVFRPTADSTIAVQDCWRALKHAHHLGWVDFTSGDADVDRCIDMQEYLHYDSPANGSLHVVVPGKLLAFTCPRDIASSLGASWSDEGGTRHFSAAYYLDIFEDFGVRVVVRSGGQHYDAHSLMMRGIGVEDLRLPSAATGSDSDLFPEFDDSPAARLCVAVSAFRNADRFLTLARLAPGAIALHGSDPDGSLGASGRLLAETYLIRAHGFGGPDALAWLLMAHPGQDGRAATIVAEEEPAERPLLPVAAVCSVNSGAGQLPRNQSCPPQVQASSSGRGFWTRPDQDAAPDGAQA